MASLAEGGVYNLSVNFDPVPILCEGVSWNGLKVLSILDKERLVVGETGVLFIRCSGGIRWFDLISLMLMHLAHFGITTSVIHLNNIIRKLNTFDNVVGREDRYLENKEQ